MDYLTFLKTLTNIYYHVPVCSDATLAHRRGHADQGLTYSHLLRRRRQAEEELQTLCGFQEVFAQFGERVCGCFTSCAL